jgi:hypothetical protein
MKKGGYKIQLRSGDEIQILGKLESGEWVCIQVLNEGKRHTSTEDNTRVSKHDGDFRL